MIETLYKDNLIFAECLIAATHQDMLIWSAVETGRTCRMEALSIYKGNMYCFIVTQHTNKRHHIYSLAQKHRDGKVDAFPVHISKDEWNIYDLEMGRPRIIATYERLHEIVIDKAKREGKYYYSK